MLKNAPKRKRTFSARIPRSQAADEIGTNKSVDILINNLRYRTSTVSYIPAILLNDIAKGYTRYQRIGAQIRIKRIEVRLRNTFNFQEGEPYNYRLAVIRARDQISTIPTPPDIWKGTANSGSSFYGPMAPRNIERITEFDVLWDHKTSSPWVREPQWTTGTWDVVDATSGPMGTDQRPRTDFSAVTSTTDYSASGNATIQAHTATVPERVTTSGLTPNIWTATDPSVPTAYVYSGLLAQVQLAATQIGTGTGSTGPINITPTAVTSETTRPTYSAHTVIPSHEAEFVGHYVEVQPFNNDIKLEMEADVNCDYVTLYNTTTGIPTYADITEGALYLMFYTDAPWDEDVFQVYGHVRIIYDDN